MKNSTKIIQQFLNGFTEDVFGGGAKLDLGSGRFYKVRSRKKLPWKLRPCFIIFVLLSILQTF